MANIADTLEQRGADYGPFEGHADITQALKDIMCATVGWKRLASDQREALDMVAHKIGRILNGNPDLVDSWHDIAGYATLVERRLSVAERV